jgi:hypothetical protein
MHIGLRRKEPRIIPVITLDGKTFYFTSAATIRQLLQGHLVCVWNGNVEATFFRITTDVLN